VGSGAEFPDGITALMNGNYVVSSPNWNANKGAVTWGNGTAGVSGTVSAANSLIGSEPSERVALGGITPLTNGNYVVDSLGAVTWGSGKAGITGTISAANSLVGDSVGGFFGFRNSIESFVTALPDGDYVVGTPTWYNSRGAATWVDGLTGTTLDGQNTIDAQNSLLGTVVNAGEGWFGYIQPGALSGTFLVAFRVEHGGRVTVAFTDPNLLTFEFEQGQTITVTPDFLTRSLDAGTNVTLQATDTLTVNSPILETPTGTPGNLILQAGRIVLNADIHLAGGNLFLGAVTVILNTGDTGAGTLALNPHSGRLSQNGQTIYLNGESTVYAYGTAADAAYLADSSGNDTFAGTATFSYLSGTDFLELAAGYGHVYAIASHGGNDLAYLYGSTGNDTFVGTPTFGYLAGNGFLNDAVGFPTVYATGNASGYHVAYLFASAASSDRFVGQPTLSYMVGGSYLNEAAGFNAVHAYATAGADDHAFLYDGAGSNLFVGTADFSYLVGANYLNGVTGFRTVMAYATAGSSDTAVLYDSPGDDVFVGWGTMAALTTPSVTYGTVSFGNVTIVSSQGGFDEVRILSALLYALTETGPWH
jgi:hypothetical protein